ncbi:MAG: RNA polymerase sigma-70 factor [Odoribacteraceae bacterium]|jgi:RNA polymerase sigma-70 factor (ECF subfamily)|nr:RNA polymerase sigma-70 factor [Odoribacteraceae bacterium]
MEKVSGQDTSDPGITPVILNALKAGSHDAYKEVYLHYADPVFHFLKLLMRSEEDAKEITQEVFIQLWEKRGRVDPAKSIKGYLYTIARNAAMNFFERKKVYSKYATFVHCLQEESSASSEDIIMAQEMATLIDAAISRMPTQRQKVFLLSREEGLSMDEIAQQLNISKNTVESHLSTAKKEIREILA